MKQVLVKTVPVLARKGTTALVPMVQAEPQTVMETWPWVAPELHVVVEVPGTEPAHTEEVASLPELEWTAELGEKETHARRK